MRPQPTSRRAAALLLATAVGVLAPGIHPLTASAQDPVPPEQGGYYATPPPPSAAPPEDDGMPDEAYEKTIDCVQRDDNLDVKDQTLLPNRPWAQDFLRLDEVHALMKSSTGGLGGTIDGQETKVAVIDTGVTQHPFFQGRVLGGGDYVKNTGGGLGLEDCDGHGTEVAGIIAGQPGDPNIGFVGMAPEARILSIRQSSENYTVPDAPPPQAAPPPAAPPEGEAPPAEGAPAPPEGEQPAPPEGEQPPAEQPEALRAPGSGDGTAPSQGSQEGDGRKQGLEGSAGDLGTLAKAVMNAANQGVQVMNISINSCRPADGRSSPEENDLHAAVKFAVEERDVVVVSAAGNIGESCPQNVGPDPKKPVSIVTPPWFSDYVLSVAAIGRDGAVAEFSLRGPWVSVAAPGTEIISLDPAAGSDKLANLTKEGNQDPAEIQGTSFAAPYVAGLAALVRAKYPELDAKQVINRIEKTAQHPGAVGGRDNLVGYGPINPMAALTSIVPGENGLAPAKSEALPSGLPPLNEASSTPMIVALAGAAGALVALGITLFVVHTIRRSRAEGPAPSRKVA
ncbi:type VII secretion-associated serine protease mycosin [Amycolatopsis antarctica]|uniref:type VII secretion-associated serine protease mycosin n=1 Tax=Amycolatopsis antarctica TaxID=1854586 RepID=UPI0023E8A0E2|nr:type VII secretion-associated serine protease mycosin [Amycolatopsis antarctica]